MEAELLDLLKECEWEKDSEKEYEFSELFTLNKYGVFSVQKFPAYKGRNPRTLEEVEVPEKLAFQFQVLDDFLDELAQLKPEGQEMIGFQMKEVEDIASVFLKVKQLLVLGHTMISVADFGRVMLNSSEDKTEYDVSFFLSGNFWDQLLENKG